MYQLTDFYSLFYLKFIKNNSSYDDDFWINGIDKPDTRAWSGYAFEQICLLHLQQIKKALGISSVQTQSSAWLGSDGNEKAQIDLLIDRDDNVINLCEMKFYNTAFSIDKKYANEMVQKMNKFASKTKTKKNLFITFITTYGLLQNQYSKQYVQNELNMDHLFKEL